MLVFRQKKPPLLPVVCQVNNGSVGRQNLFLFTYFLIEEKTVNPELKRPSIYQLKRKKTKY